MKDRIMQIMKTENMTQQEFAFLMEERILQITMSRPFIVAFLI